MDLTRNCIFLLVLFLSPVSAQEIFRKFQAEMRETSVISRILSDVVDEFIGDDYSTNYVPGDVSASTLDVVNEFLSMSERLNFFTFYDNINAMSGQFFPHALFSGVIFAETFENFLDITSNNEISRRLHNLALKYIFYISNLTIYDLENSVLCKRYYKRLSIVSHGFFMYAFFIIDEGDTVALVSSEWYSEGYCNECHFKVLNRFDKKSMKWQAKLENYEKFLQYNGCDLVLLLPVPMANGRLFFVSGYAILQPDMKSFSARGIIPRIFESASKAFNFTPSFQPAEVPFNFIDVFDVHTLDFISNNGVFKLPQIFFDLIPVHKLKYLLRYTNVCVALRKFMVSTPGEAYTNYEKLTHPFDSVTWILLFSTFVITFVTILVLNRMSSKARDVVYGRKIENPIWNVISIFFGISQTRLPDQNFPRYILILFVMFCLIFRTCFQSKFFEFMTSQPRKPPPKTFADLVDKNYTIYTSLYDTIFNNTRDEHGRLLNIEKIDLADYYNLFNKQSQNASAMLALYVDEFFQNHFENFSRKNYDWNQIDEDVYTSNEAFAFKYFSFYFRMFDKMINRFIETGVMEFLVEKYYTKRTVFVEPEKEPQVLTVQDLAFGFNIWMGCCLVCLIAFVFELMCLLFVRLRPKIMGENRFARVHPMKLDKRNLCKTSKDHRKVLQKFKVKSEKVSKIPEGPNQNENERKIDSQEMVVAEAHVVEILDVIDLSKED